MFRSLLLIIVLVVGLIVTAIWTVPLEVVLRQSGLTNGAYGWSHVEGTLRKGRINGLFTNDQAIGDIAMELRPLSLLSFQPVYDLQWGGAGGRGTGVVRLAGKSVEFSSVQLQQEIAAIEGLSAPIRSLGGTVRLRDGSAKLSSKGCERATGEITTDALSRAASAYGREFGTVTGPISCTEGAVELDLSGTSQSGDALIVDAGATFLGEARFLAEMTTKDNELSLVLSTIGFQYTDDVWRYAYQTEGRGFR